VQSLSSADELPARLAVESAEAPPGHQRSTRRLFLTRFDAGTVRAAGNLAEPGASLVLVGHAPVRLHDLVLPAEARLAQVSGYHPDLVPEALALLRRGEVTPPRAESLTI
jgi:hypothetical protein